MKALPCSVSVVMPAYNCARFISRAIDSVLVHDSVGELIIVDDGSVDDTLLIAQSYAYRDHRVRLLQHNDKRNHGAGISRNLGITNSNGQFISFLDADDYYLENRFDSVLLMLAQRPELDGVYGSIGVEYYDQESENLHRRRMRLAKKNIQKLIIPEDHTGIEVETSAQSLFYYLLTTERGWIHLDALTVRRSSLTGFSLFMDCQIGEDSEFITRLAAERQLLGTDPMAPVAIRGVHSMNRITRSGTEEKCCVTWNKWLDYALESGKNKKTLFYLLMRSCDDSDRLNKLCNLVRMLLKQPRLIHALIGR